MVAPIVGPITSEIGGGGPDSQDFYSYITRYRQKRPYTISLPYRSHIGKVDQRVGTPPVGARYLATSDVVNFYDWTDVEARSYDKLKGKAYDQAEMGTTLAEAHQSLSMIASRAGQLARFTRSVWKFNFVQAARDLRLMTVPKGVSRRKSSANNWLEFHFGWVPLIKDINSAVEVLQGTWKPPYIKASSKGPTFVQDLQPPQDIYNPGAEGPWTPYRWIFFERLQMLQMVSAQGARFSINNPNLHLAHQLGLVNPVSIAWELVPFSFVVDWFTNVGQFLSLGTDFLGLTVEEPWNVRHLKMDYTSYFYVQYRYWNGDQPPTYHIATERNDFIQKKMFHTVRGQGLVTPGLYVRPLKLWGWQRALTAVSLLTQKLVGR